MYHNEKVLKASDQRDIVWFVSSACYLKALARVLQTCKKITFCFTGAIDILLGAVVRRPQSALNLGFFFNLVDHVLCGTTDAELHNSVDLLCGTTDAELHNSLVNLLCGTTDAKLNNLV